MSEMSATLQWLAQTLAGAGGAQGVYRNVAPPDAPTPYLVLTFYSAAPDETEVASIRLWADTTWLIEAWGPDTQGAAIEAVAKAADVILHRASATVADGSILMCVRESPRYGPAQMVGNTLWSRQGGLYRIIVQET